MALPDPTALFDLTGRRALITGGGRGLGFAIARALAGAGAAVVLNGRDAAALEQAAEQLAADGAAAVETCAFDVTDGEAVALAVAGLEDQGPLDILVNNAGIQRRGALEDFPEADWRAVIDTNLTALFLVGRAVARPMIARRRGKIINIASVASELARPTIAPYVAAKGGVKTLTRAMAAEWARHNIQVNAIAPGYFATEMNTALIADPEFDAWVRRRTPAGRWAQPDELAGAAIFLASNASNFVSGHVLMVDGAISVTL